jgi:hypothetical protein
MTAAIYARKSTTQDVSDEQLSLGRQEEHAPPPTRRAVSSHHPPHTCPEGDAQCGYKQH